MNLSRSVLGVKTKRFLQKHSVPVSLAAAFLAFGGYVVLRPAYRQLISASSSTEVMVWDGVLRFLFALPAIVLLGILVDRNGFRYVFTLQNFGKSMLAAIPLILYMITMPMQRIYGFHFDDSFFSQMPSIFVFDKLSAVYEEVVFRGLLLTVPLLRWGGKPWKRLLLVFLGSLFFGSGHYSAQGINGVIVSTINGLCFASIYLYSGNLFAAVVIHSTWNDFVKAARFIPAEVEIVPVFLQVLMILQYLIHRILTPIAASVFIIKANRFAEHLRPVQPQEAGPPYSFQNRG